jgi:hypothetical protein
MNCDKIEIYEGTHKLYILKIIRLVLAMHYFIYYIQEYDKTGRPSEDDIGEQST